MTAISRLILTFAANLTAVLIAAYFVEEFQVTTNISDLLAFILILAIVNLSIRPILNLILSPLIFITFGLFTIVINAAILYTIDIYSDYITINGLWPLIEVTHIVGIVNIIINYAALFLYRGSDIA